MIERTIPNTSIVLGFTPDSSFSGLLGCHATVLYNLNRPKATIMRDPKREIPTIERYYDQELGQRPMGKLLEESEKLIRTDPKLREDIFKELAHSNRVYSVVCMSGNCHSDKTPFKTHHIWGDWSVASFVTWLKNQGESILASPVMTNFHHVHSANAGMDPTGFSLLRMWMWFPKPIRGDVVHIQDTEYMANMRNSQFVPITNWRKVYSALPKFNVEELNG